ncbi:DNA-deoxyinosine glycosylase [Cohnella candidum]|uniref:DNA-deoxyinosine glycosylase n=1 Tax=Cohnella candidum TaxID=2674991 RepID=A0A3G3JTZ1_9BACL|nr:DNA-deoxyinosine glycosylase [Cohnella candidum]AYQ71664.1 DNA-deoxyinosine glycosylase [Cohnella candidum]
MIVHSFPPVADSRSKLLILGSMPGTASLRAGQYYWNPRNHMWAILYTLFGDGVPEPEYDSRIAFALRNRIALWDSIAACEREGSLDADIKDAVPNDIPGLLRQYPQIGAIVCNGNKSFAELQKHHGASPEVAERQVLKLPSTSPVPTPRYRGFPDKLEAWRVIKDLL